MIRTALIIAVILLACLIGPATAEDDVDRALEDLSSPFLEVRQRAVRTLSTAGARAEEKLFAAYATADFRTKALILETFRNARAVVGLPIVLGDLACPDRGVAAAQRRLVSEVYGTARRFVRDGLVPLVPRDSWQLEERLLGLPGPMPSVRAALDELVGRTDGELAKGASRARDLVRAVDRMRRGFVRLALSKDRDLVRHARTMLLRIRTHDIERAFLSVFEVRGLEGTYDGMFAVVRELEIPEGAPETRPARRILRIVLDRAASDAGRSGARDRPYEFLEPVRQRPNAVRDLAALCLLDLGDAGVLPDLARFYRTLPMLDEEGLADNPKERVAHTCAALGDSKPLEDYLEKIETWIDDSGSPGVYVPSYILHRQAGLARSRLGDHEKAEGHFIESAVRNWQDALPYYNLACVLCKAGKPEEALSAVEESVDRGYGADWSQVEWMERDGDLAPMRRLPAYRDLVRRLVRHLPPRER